MTVNRAEDTTRTWVSNGRENRSYHSMRRKPGQREKNWAREGRQRIEERREMGGRRKKERKKKRGTEREERKRERKGEREKDREKERSVGSGIR